MNDPTALSALQTLTQDDAQKLNSAWISSVEELLAKASAANAVEGLARLIDCSTEHVEEILAEARLLIPPDQRAELERKPSIDRGMGLIVDEPNGETQNR